MPASDTKWYFCSDIPMPGYCCGSCHEDAEHGYLLIQIDEDDGVIVEICCAVSSWLEGREPALEVADAL